MKFLLLCLMALLVSCSTTIEHKPVGDVADVSEIPTPEIDKGKELTLWSTFYYAPSYKSVKIGHAVRDINGKSLGVNLPRKDLCNLMLQGSGYVDGQIYGWGGVSSYKSTNCTKYYPLTVASGRLKFKKDIAIRGVKNFKIEPFKSIAVDPKVIPYESVLFIPDLKGIKYRYNGKEYIHDGYVKALDTGHAIKGNHIDFYVGPNPGGWRDALVDIVKKYGFDKFVKSTSSGTFKAYIVE